MNHTTLLLSDKQIRQKVRRIAYQIIENNQNIDKLFICGLNQRGSFLADLINVEIEQLDFINLKKAHLTINKSNQVFFIEEDSINKSEFNNSTVIIIDDVLNTGKTLMQAINFIFSFNPTRIETCFLAQRNHKMYPVIGDYVGLKLATTFQEHIYFNIKNPQQLELFIQ